MHASTVVQVRVSSLTTPATTIVNATMRIVAVRMSNAAYSSAVSRRPMAYHINFLMMEDNTSIISHRIVRGGVASLGT